MIERHPCYGCTKAKSLMTSPSSKKRTMLCKIYYGVIVKKCADFQLYAKKPKGIEE